jgi:lipopolysaccharide export system protein LptC
MKVLLPLAALAILSTLFMVAETLDPEKAIPFAQVDVDRILREQGVSRPTFGTVTETGAQISLAADAVRPVLGVDARFRGTELVSVIVLESGTRIDIAAREGLIDVAARESVLRGGARLSTSDGYVITTDQIIARYDIVHAEAPGEVTAQGPAGEIVAGSLLLTDQGDGKSARLVFNNGVRLIYRPGAE